MTKIAYHATGGMQVCSARKSVSPAPPFSADQVPFVEARGRATIFTHSMPSSSSSRAKSSAEIREAEDEALIVAQLESHGGYLAQPILSTANSLEIAPLTIVYFLAVIALAFHLVLPAFLLPHYSALITLIPPLQSSLHAVANEVKKKDAPDAAQWCVYWVIYAVFELARGVVGTFCPAWIPAFELGRTVCLVICAGPWFGKAGLVSLSVGTR